MSLNNITNNNKQTTHDEFSNGHSNEEDSNIAILVESLKNQMHYRFLKIHQELEGLREYMIRYYSSH